MSRRDRGLAVVCGAMFVSAVDMTIVNVALPDISEDLDAGIDGIGRSQFGHGAEGTDRGGLIKPVKTGGTQTPQGAQRFGLGPNPDEGTLIFANLRGPSHRLIGEAKAIDPTLGACGRFYFWSISGD